MAERTLKMQDTYGGVHNTTVVTQCSGCSADIEFHSDCGADQWGFVWLPFSNAEFTQVVQFWYEQLSPQQQEDVLIQLKNG